MSTQKSEASTSQAILPHILREQFKLLAEKADGLRDEGTVCLVYDGSKFDIVPASSNPPGAVLTVDTDHRHPNETNRPRVVLIPEPPLKDGDGNAINLERVDAWFTSAAAVEKFVIPYYAQIYGAKFAADLLDAFRNNKNAVGMIHEPESIPSLVQPEDSLNSVVNFVYAR